MNLRKAGDNREALSDELGMRKKAAYVISKGYDSKRGISKVSAAAVRTGGGWIRAGTRIVKKQMHTKEARIQINILTKEQKKQWNAYSFQKQAEILKEVQQVRAFDSSGISLYQKAEALKETLNQRAKGDGTGRNWADRWEVPIPKGKTGKEMKKNLAKGKMEKITFYTENQRYGIHKVKNIEKKYQKIIKEEKKERRVQYLSSLLSAMGKEDKKLKIRERQMEGDISQMQAENQVISGLTGYLSFPIKVKLQAAMQKVIREWIRYAAAALAKYALLPLGILFALVILVSVLVNLAGGGSTDSGSGAVEIANGGYSVQGTQIAEYAKQWIGTPYVWGGTDLNIAVDCSGFTFCVYNNFGITLPRTAREQGNTEEGAYVNTLSEAIPGDLIWWTPRHVGVYLGDGKAIQSSGDESNYDLSHAGKGVSIVAADYRNIGTIRRFVTDGGIGTEGFAKDTTEYNKEELELIWAIVAQEDSGSYEGSLAVISSAMNRVSSPVWSYTGTNALEQLTAPGQYCYSDNIGGNWQGRLNGNVPIYTKQAVQDCLEKGIRNHAFTSFRSTSGGDNSRVQIGGNWYFG